MDSKDTPLQQILSTKPDNSDLTVLRRQLLQISQKHYYALWSDKGPMSQALRGKFTGKQQFEALRPDIKAIHQPDAENSEDYKDGNFEAQKYDLTASAMELRKDKKTPIFAYQLLSNIYAGQVDDFRLFNEAYGLAFSSIDDTYEGFSIHYTPYHVHNGVITTINNAYEKDDQKDLPESQRWQALVTLMNATTTLNKNINPDRADNTYPINSITTIYSWLENLREPLQQLNAQTDCTGLSHHVQSQYEQSYEEVFKYLYFKKDQQRALANYFGLSLPAKGLNYREFLTNIGNMRSQLTLEPHKKQLAAAIHDFAQGRLNHIGFQAEIIKIRNLRPSSFLNRFVNYILAIFTPGMGRFSALNKLYNDTFFVENTIHPQFKKVRAECDKELAREEVDSNQPSPTYISVLSRLSAEQKSVTPKSDAVLAPPKGLGTQTKAQSQTVQPISKAVLTQALIAVRKHQTKAMVKAHLEKEIAEPTRNVVAVF